MDELTAKTITRLRKLYPFDSTSLTRIEYVLTNVIKLFAGRRKGYQACNTKYHDLEHTCDGFILMVEILLGLYEKGPCNQEIFDLSLIAFLLHDTGYIQRVDDNLGTGAKYTFFHVERSCAFAQLYLKKKHFSNEDIVAICNMIRCTGVGNNTEIPINTIKFATKEEKLAGYALGTADLLSQMAVLRYPEMLQNLYNEFEEAYEFMGPIKLKKMGISPILSCESLIKATPSFWQYVQNRLIRDYGSVFQYLSLKRKREIWKAVETNIKRIRKKIEQKQLR